MEEQIIEMDTKEEEINGAYIKSYSIEKKNIENERKWGNESNIKKAQNNSDCLNDEKNENGKKFEVNSKKDETEKDACNNISAQNNSDCLNNGKKENGKKFEVNSKKDKTEKEACIKEKYKNYIFILICIIVLLFAIFSPFFIKNSEEEGLIDNNNEINVGVLKIVEDENDNIIIKKQLLKIVNYFIGCLGTPGSGKSTFASNYYKKLYKVKNDYFESSDRSVTYTKGVWTISDEERRKIPKYIIKDILDVEGFKEGKSKTKKYVIAVAFLSTELIIFNRNERYDDVGTMLSIIQNSFIEMKKKIYQEF